MDKNRQVTEQYKKKPNQKMCEIWDVDTIMAELEALGTERTKKTYKNHGAHDPLFGVTTGAMKPLSKKIKKCHELAMKLYETGNYDAMYFAGMIADVSVMTESDFETWMEKAYCQGLSDYVVAVTLAETTFAQKVADRWLNSKKELYQSAGWSCYSWLLGVRPDSEFDSKKMKEMLDYVERTIHTKPNLVRYAMNGFVIALGISYLPLHKEAVHSAKAIGAVEVDMGNTNCKTPLAFAYIEKAEKSGRLGFKRKNVRC